MKGMTLIELNEVLGEQIRKVVKNEPNARVDAVLIVSLAKQMINNADVIMRAEKLRSQGILMDSHMEELIVGTKEKFLLEGSVLNETTEGSKE